MPGGDRTGPSGMGPMTGRAAGYCGGNGMPGYMNPAFGRGFGGGFGRGRGFGGRGGGRGWRNMYYATGLPGWMRYGGYAGAYPYGSAVPYPYAAPYSKLDPDVEKQALKNQADALQAELEMVKKRLDEIEAGTEA
ncbi:MAG: DUF5320 domain-containing protein [Candidatus Eisenbacteria bacterium]|nr:DUF5320 domain-containing protein [Candidatus Eisenbacteria bacterium]